MVWEDHPRGKVRLEELHALNDGLTSLVPRLFFFQIAGFFERTKYYAIWTLTEVRARNYV